MQGGGALSVSNCLLSEHIAGHFILFTWQYLFYTLMCAVLSNLISLRGGEVTHDGLYIHKYIQ